MATDQTKSIKAPNENLLNYVDYRCRRALEICDDDLRRSALAQILVKSTEHGLGVTLKAAEEIARLLVSPGKKHKGRPFVSPAEKARRVGQMAILVTHFRLKPSKAAELVSAAISTEADKPIDPSGLRKLWKVREDLWRLAFLETEGQLSFRPTGFRYPDSEWFFTDDEISRLLLAKLTVDLEKKIKDFFLKSS